jgi:oligopeptide/dipeptide ABC transporter ATP-binding protein
MSELFALDHVSVRFTLSGGLFRGRPRTLHAVQDVSFAIGESETLALVGESGSGKTTIGNVVAGLQTPSAGTLRFRGRVLDRTSRPEARRAIQIVFQDPVNALDPRMLVSTIIEEPLRIQGRDGCDQQHVRAAELIQQVGLPRDSLNRYPHEFSGGQRQRIAIARALAPRPTLIVADEPLSALDVSIQSQILNLMRDVQDTYKVSYLFISHDLAVVNHLADRVAVLYLGRLVEIASRADLFARPSHPYTRALLRSLPRVGQKRKRGQALLGEIPSPLAPPPGCVFHPRCPLAKDICRNIAPRLEPVSGRVNQHAACHFREEWG